MSHGIAGRTKHFDVRKRVGELFRGGAPERPVAEFPGRESLVRIAGELARTPVGASPIATSFAIAFQRPWLFLTRLRFFAVILTLMHST